MTLTYRIILFFALQVVINAPLVSLNGLLTLLNDNTLSEMQVKELFPKLIQDVGYTSDLLESLLQWAKTQLQGIHSNPKKIVLQPLVADNIALLGNTAAQKKIALIQEIVEEAMVFADEDMLRTILRNLIANAIKFTQVNGEVHISAKNIGENIEITVQDTGVGMTQEIINQLFKGNITTRGTKNEKGTGLGLILVKDFIEKNNGTIQVESEVGKGSTFRLTLPIHEGQ